MYQTRRRVAGLALAVVMAIGWGVVDAPASHAATPSCESGKTCLWGGVDYTTYFAAGSSVSFWYGIPDLSQFNYYFTYATAYKTATSVSNKGREMSVTLYDGKKYAGKYLKLPKGGGYPNLAKLKDASGKNWNDRIASGRFV